MLQAKELLTKDPDAIRADAAATAERSARVAGGIQEGAGQIIGGIMNLLPPRIVIGVRAGLSMRTSTPPPLDPDPEQAADEKLARDSSELGASLAGSAWHIGDELAAGNYETVCSLSIMALAAAGTTPGLEPICVKIRLNYGVALAELGQWEKATEMLLAVLQSSASTERLRGLAKNQLAEIMLRRDCFSADSFDEETQVKFAETATALKDAAKMLEGKRYPALGLVSLADKALELKQLDRAKSLAADAEAFLKKVPAADLADVKTADELRARFPNLSARRGFVRTNLPSLSVDAPPRRRGTAHLLVVLLMAAAFFGLSGHEDSQSEFSLSESAGTRARAGMLATELPQLSGETAVCLESAGTRMFTESAGTRKLTTVS